MTKKQACMRAKICEKGFGISMYIVAIIEQIGARGISAQQMGARGMMTKRCLKLPSEKRDTQIT